MKNNKQIRSFLSKKDRDAAVVLLRKAGKSVKAFTETGTFYKACQGMRSYTYYRLQF